MLASTRGRMASIRPYTMGADTDFWGVIMADEKFSNFLTDIIDADLAEGKVDVVHTRFPPEPNGYLHIGSAKAIFINYTIAKHYGGLFNLRFDDTNPAREGDEYVQSILQDLKWLGAEPNGGIFYGSDYFERCYEYAEQLIKEGKAYVDDLTPTVTARRRRTSTCSAVCARASLPTAKKRCAPKSTWPART